MCERKEKMGKGAVRAILLKRGGGEKGVIRKF
jgi:hypothetical protein